MVLAGAALLLAHSWERFRRRRELDFPGSAAVFVAGWMIVGAVALFP